MIRKSEHLWSENPPCVKSESWCAVFKKKKSHRAKDWLPEDATQWDLCDSGRWNFPVAAEEIKAENWRGIYPWWVRHGRDGNYGGPGRRALWIEFNNENFGILGSTWEGVGRSSRYLTTGCLQGETDFQPFAIFRALRKADQILGLDRNGFVSRAKKVHEICFKKSRRVGPHVREITKKESTNWCVWGEKCRRSPLLWEDGLKGFRGKKGRFPLQIKT